MLLANSKFWVTGMHLRAMDDVMMFAKGITTYDNKGERRSLPDDREADSMLLCEKGMLGKRSG